MTTTTTILDASEIDHLVASEQYRLQTFDSLTHFPSETRRQLALAGFVYRQSQCVCPQCGIEINLTSIDTNTEYAPNYFRKLHRKKVAHLGKRCSFLLCVATNIDDLRTPPSSQQQPQWDDAEEPEYNQYSMRLQSLESWPPLERFTADSAQKTFVTPETMAKHGFFFSGPDDGVTCFYCGNTLVNWADAIASTNENIVQLEHARFFPCRFVTYTAGGKFVANAGYFHSVLPQERRDRNPMTSTPIGDSKNDDNKPRTTDECLATFENWPSYAPVSAQALAETGFYYLGDELRVKCFMCDLEVDNWVHGMTALGTHRKRKNDCQIIRAIDSTKTGDIQTANEKWRLETLVGLSFFHSNSNDTKQLENDQRLCRELAACGFYRHKNSKIIRCAYCGVTIEPKPGSSIMSQHRHLAKQSCKKTPMITTNDPKSTHTVDCLIVRAQCPANIVIPHRERFPEYPLYQSIFDRIKTFENYQQRHKVTDGAIREMAEAGFFFDEHKCMRCFQCGNSLSSKDKIRREKYPDYNMAQLHAHLYPTCEWIKEILGVKYIAQVLHDRYQSKEPQPQTSYNAQSSSASSTQTTISSFSSVLATPATADVSPPSFSNPLNEPFLSEGEESSDEEGFQTVARPSTASFANSIQPLRSPPPSAPSHESSTTEHAQTCSDPTSTDYHSQLTSPMMANQTNPFKRQYFLQEQKREHTGDSISSDNGSHEMSPVIGNSPAISSPVDVPSLLAHESHRLDTFKKLKLERFANVDVAHLAYVGFYLNAEGTEIQCPWCEVRLTEKRFEEIVRTRPAVTRSTITDEPWTPMRVHRHENGILMDQDHPWCTWVRREAGGLYPNVTMLVSQMLYPEYPSYSKIEKRIQSFASDWIYPSGSRLSNQMMAEAGFFNMGGGSVCCYYCGNKLQSFEPRDCPFEEHATFYPLCDFIQHVRGLDYINRIILECGRIPQGRLRYETDGKQKIKRIIFDKSGPSKRKSERPPVNRINSYSSRSSSRNVALNETVDDLCLICSEHNATHEYDPCGHYRICGECFARLDSEHLQRCMICLKPATIKARSPNTPRTQ
ncbi:unnamed protein product [Adineta ricciae]|uniref:RING-type domain-containing protein n=1 Tax=Adineta ricciae TaxID=249248 RepID=A0A814P3A3_ADIRI|nr:unnamed protein product [Adineta ricciae]CAF1100639.1 unnamed protein product [Adineta ricciae]